MVPWPARERAAPSLYSHDPRQEAAHDSARQSARLLRGRRTRDPDRRARDRALRRSRSMCVTRSCTTASWSRAWRPRVQSSSRSSTRCRTTGRWCSPPMACRRRCRPRRRRRQTALPRRHLPAGLQGPSSRPSAIAESGRTVILIGHAGHPEVVGTMGQLPPGGSCWSRTLAQVERLSVADRVESRLCDADDAVGRRHGRDRHRAAPPLPGDPRPEDGRHLLRDHQPPGRGEGDRRAVRRAGRDRRAQLVELDAAGRGRAQATAAPGASWCSAPPTWTGPGWAMRSGSASPPAPRRPRSGRGADRRLPRALRRHDRGSAHDRRKRGVQAAAPAGGSDGGLHGSQRRRARGLSRGLRHRTGGILQGHRRGRREHQLRAGHRRAASTC